jgi:hypothetical protein
MLGIAIVAAKQCVKRIALEVGLVAIPKQSEQPGVRAFRGRIYRYRLAGGGVDRQRNCGSEKGKEQLRFHVDPLSAARDWRPGWLADGKRGAAAIPQRPFDQLLDQVYQKTL